MLLKIDIIKDDIISLGNEVAIRRREIADLRELLTMCSISAPEYKLLQDKIKQLTVSVTNINLCIFMQKQVLNQLYKSQHTK